MINIKTLRINKCSQNGIINIKLKDIPFMKVICIHYSISNKQCFSNEICKYKILFDMPISLKCNDCIYQWEIKNKKDLIK